LILETRIMFLLQKALLLEVFNMKLAIIDYGSGNLRSVQNAFNKNVIDNNLKIDIKVTNNLSTIKSADYIVLPGVGSFPDCKKGLLQIDGLIDTLQEEIVVKEKLFLGICVGMQLMTDYSLEKIKTYGLGWLKGHLKKIDISGNDYLGNKFRLPHMGWNNLQILDNSHPFLKNISDVDQFYFVHSYFLTEGIKHEILANTTYSHELPAIIGNKNFFGVQFHPEKSSFAGQKIISNWLGL